MSQICLCFACICIRKEVKQLEGVRAGVGVGGAVAGGARAGGAAAGGAGEARAGGAGAGGAGAREAGAGGAGAEGTGAGGAGANFNMKFDMHRNRIQHNSMSSNQICAKLSTSRIDRSRRCSKHSLKGKSVHASVTNSARDTETGPETPNLGLRHPAPDVRRVRCIRALVR